jgi:hypothetical protein
VDQQWKWEKSKDGVGLWLVKLAVCAWGRLAGTSRVRLLYGVLPKSELDQRPLDLVEGRMATK